MALNILKEHTTGLCPLCYEKIDARVIEEDDKVFIVKNCPEHGESRGLLEKDVEFYKKILAARKSDALFDRCLMINVTHNCNLRCHLCYIPERAQEKDLSTDKIKEAIRKYPGRLIALSGGEPTLREDLPEIISYIKSQNKITIMATNGIKLADYDYLKTLKDAGLVVLNFSCNGFTEDVFLSIENAPLLKTKMKSLENVKKLGIKTQFSFTIHQGVNDKQFGQALKYILDNQDFVYQLRTRVTAPIGNSMGDKTIFLSDFLGMLAKEMGVPRSAIVDYWLSHSLYPSPYLFGMNYHEFMADYKKESCEPGPGGALVLFSWPDKNNIDYEAIKSLDLDILTSDLQFLNFWDGIIRNEKHNFL